MAKEDTITIDGVVEELLPNMHFRVTLQNGMKVIAHLCGKMRMKNIRLFYWFIKPHIRICNDMASFLACRNQLYFYLSYCYLSPFNKRRTWDHPGKRSRKN